MESSFKETIKEHLQLKERNRWIEPTMPLARYLPAEDPVQPRSEHAGADSAGADSAGADSGQVAVRSDILDPDGPAGWPTAEGLGLEGPEALWAGAAPAFDWGD